MQHALQALKSPVTGHRADKAPSETHHCCRWLTSAATDSSIAVVSTAFSQQVAKLLHSQHASAWLAQRNALCCMAFILLHKCMLNKVSTYWSMNKSTTGVRYLEPAMYSTGHKSSPGHLYYSKVQHCLPSPDITAEQVSIPVWII